MTYEEIRKKHISGGTSQSKSQSGTSSSYYAIRTKHGLGDEVDEDYINSYIRDFNSYASSSQKDYDGLNYKTARNYSEKYRKANDDLAYRANNIRSYLQANKDNIDSKTYEELQSYLKESSNALDTAHRTFDKANKFYSQWDTEEDYNSYLKGIEEKENLLKYDTKAAKTEIDSLDSRIASLESNISQMQTDYNNKYGSGNGTQKEYAPMLGNNDPYANTPNNGNPYGSGAYRPPANPTGVVSGTSHEAQEMLDKIGAAQNELATLRKDRSAKNTTYNRATHLQTADKLYNTAINAEDFEKLSQEGAANE
jgi:hypothetical protein